MVPVFVKGASPTHLKSTWPTHCMHTQ